MTPQPRQPTNKRPAKPPLRWTGVLFAFAANLLLTTTADMLAQRLPFGFDSELLATIAAPLLAGVLTALYVRQRGGMHAFLGALISLPVLALWIFGGNWQLAILTFSFCTLGGALSEIVLRGRSA